MARTQTAAIAEAKSWVGDSYPAGWCQKWVVTEIFQSGGVGDWDGDSAADAEDGWKAARKKVATTDAMAVPAGYPIYFTGGSSDHGHAAVSAGGGYMYSTDRPYVGKIGKVPIRSVESAWGVRFVGYVITDGNGNTFTDAPIELGPPVWGQPDTWKLDDTGPDATRLGERINAWNAVLGLPTFTPDDNFSSTERNALTKLQIAWGFGGATADLATGGASDGYPGALTFTKLDETPVKPEPVVKLTGLHWNIAGSDVNNGYKAENGTRGPAVARHALDIGFEVFTTCEAGQNDLRAGMNTVIGNLSPWEQRAKAIWHKSTVTKITARKAYPADDIFSYLSTRKWGAAIFGVKGGKRFAVLEIHTDYRDPAKQAKQVASIFRKFRADCDALGIKHVNQIVCGDFNWDGTTTDNPFNALAAWNFVEKGDRDIATFLTGKHLDGVLAHKDADVTVTRPPRANSAGVRLSDHYPLRFVIELA